MSEHNCNCHDENCEHDHEHDEITVKLTLDNDEELECVVLTIFEVGEQAYIALLPIQEGDDSEDGEVYLYRFFEDESGEPTLDNIEDDDEYEAVADAFDEWLDAQEFEEDDEEDN